MKGKLVSGLDDFASEVLGGVRLHGADWFEVRCALSKMSSFLPVYTIASRHSECDRADVLNVLLQQRNRSPCPNCLRTMRGDWQVYIPHDLEHFCAQFICICPPPPLVDKPKKSAMTGKLRNAARDLRAPLGPPKKGVLVDPDL